MVRPRISGANVTGLGTLISGAYIGLEIGSSKETKRDFVALETPPVVTGDVPGRFFVLKTPDLGSLDNGTPIFFRRLQVGQVASYELDKDGKFLTVKVFVRAPYDQYVNPNTRFWQASGIDVSLSASGLKVQTQSVLSILIGGIAFETAATGPVLPPAEANTVFTLFSNRAEAFKPAARNPQTYQLIFKESVRGLDARRAGRVPRHPDRRGRRRSRASRPEDLRVLGAGDYPAGPAATRGQGPRPGVWRGSRADAQEVDRFPGGPRGPRATADGQPADRGRVRGLRLFPRRAPGDGGLVAEAGAVADHSGPAPGD